MVTDPEQKLIYNCFLFSKVNFLAHMTEVKLADWQLKRLVKYKKLLKKMMNEERKKGAHSQSQDFPNIGAHAFNIVVQSENEELDMSDLSESSHDSDDEKVIVNFFNYPKDKLYYS